MHALAAFVQDYIAHPGDGVRFKESEVGAQCSSGLDEGLIVNEASEHLARFPVSVGYIGYSRSLLPVQQEEI